MEKITEAEGGEGDSCGPPHHSIQNLQSTRLGILLCGVSEVQRSDFKELGPLAHELSPPVQAFRPLSTPRKPRSYFQPQKVMGEAIFLSSQKH